MVDLLAGQLLLVLDVVDVEHEVGESFPLFERPLLLASQVLVLVVVGLFLKE